MSNMGVFHWIRDAVRRSVLLGFSDAVEQLGGAAGADEQLHPQLAAVLREAAAPALANAATPSGPQAGGTKPKRLGRSLEQFRHNAPKPAEGSA
ncbi:MAG: hypothetical protein WD845_08675 [Pirellulales bacterium]